MHLSDQSIIFHCLDRTQPSCWQLAVCSRTLRQAWVGCIITQIFLLTQMHIQSTKIVLWGGSIYSYMICSKRLSHFAATSSKPCYPERLIYRQFFDAGTLQNQKCYPLFTKRCWQFAVSFGSSPWCLMNSWRISTPCHLNYWNWRWWRPNHPMRSFGLCWQGI